ncbi:uncharacterized protein LOC135140135 isoform X2 [Zophobas morio]|uniref:uncharacterized protein LOC135140135 isoform X2 n=1 Tax=Zophobas morio TaxID=2755281 RepID=UPI003082F516
MHCAIMNIRLKLYLLSAFVYMVIISFIYIIAYREKKRLHVNGCNGSSRQCNLVSVREVMDDINGGCNNNNAQSYSFHNGHGGRKSVFSKESALIEV